VDYDVDRRHALANAFEELLYVGLGPDIALCVRHRGQPFRDLGQPVSPPRADEQVVTIARKGFGQGRPDA
jgi:hypothetical protein